MYLSFFLVVFVGCLGARASLSPEPLFPSPIWLRQLGESLRLGMGAHGWVAGICQPWGQFFYLGAGWPQWKPLGIPGTHLPLKRGSWLNLVKCNLTKLTTTSLAVKRSTSLAVKRFISLAVKPFTSLAVKRFTSLAVKRSTS